MTKTLHKIAYTILSLFFFCVLLAVDFISTAKGAFPVSAEDTVIVNFDETDISNDLKDLDMKEYPKNENGRHELIRFMEYCYSSRPFIVQNDLYGLYLYVYNPTEKAVKTSSTNNVANMATSYNKNGEPSAYSNVKLICLDWTEDNRFYKFKVAEAFLGRAQRYASEHDGKRRYDVAGIQLAYIDGSIGAFNADDEKVAKTYFYTGHAKGCLTDENESTLKCEFDDLKTLSLDVHSTYYRPIGHNGENVYSRDTLHSVYFAVPNSDLEKYGVMTAVQATWINAILKPALVTGNESAYNAILPYLGKNVSEIDLAYAYLGGANLQSTTTYDPVTQTSSVYQYWTGDIGYNVPRDNGDYININFKDNVIANALNSLYMLFPPDSFERNSSDAFELKYEYIKNQMQASSVKFEGDTIEGAEAIYSKAIFENIEDTPINKRITIDEEYDLREVIYTPSKWEMLWGAEMEYSEVFNDIKAIYPVQASDFVGDYADISNRLYVAECDVVDLINFYNASSRADKSVYILRYKQSQTKVEEATLFQPTDTLLTIGEFWEKVDTNAYFWQQSVDLNFDIINVELMNNGVSTIIPVVADPTDIVHDVPPPSDITEDPPPHPCFCIPFISVACDYDDKCECWGLGCRKWLLIVGVIGIIILFPLLYIITYPIRLLFRGATAMAKAERKQQDKNKKE